jgi:hypothetical protein
MIESALFVLKPEMSKDKEAGQNSLISTILGGVSAWIFYWLIVAVPEYHFYIILMLLTTLIFGMNIFSTIPGAKYHGLALITLLILVNGSMGEGSSFTTLFAMRIILIILATLYIVAVLKILDSYWPAKQKA